MCPKFLPQEGKSFHDVVKEVGNPFQEVSANLLVLDTKNVADPALVSTISIVHQRGNYQFLSFTERFEKTAEVYSVSQARRILFPTLNKS